LNYTPTEEPLLPEEGGILQKFEEELEINDFPQQVTCLLTSLKALSSEQRVAFVIVFP
jgi:hypothetical protein